MLPPPPPPPPAKPRGTAKPEAVRANTPAPALLSLSMSLRVSWMLFGLAIVSSQFAQLSASPPIGLGGAEKQPVRGGVSPHPSKLAVGGAALVGCGGRMMQPGRGTSIAKTTLCGEANDPTLMRDSA